MEAIMQCAHAPDEAVLITHETAEAAMRRALDRIGRLDRVTEPPRITSVETPRARGADGGGGDAGSRMERV